jgi:hypothetical protein
VKAENDMAVMRQALWSAVLLSGWLAGAAAIRAETVPLPTPTPAPKDHAAPAAPSTQSSAAPAATQTPPLNIPNILDTSKNFLDSLNPFNGRSNHPATDPSTLDAKQRALVNRVSI